MNITFVKPAHHYDPYIDFWKLVELSDFPIIPLKELDVSREGVYIVSPIHQSLSDAESGWRAKINEQAEKPRNAHLILWDLERPIPRGGMPAYTAHARKLFEERYFDEIWVSDQRLAQEARLRFVILGSDEGLGTPGTPGDKEYDFCHMSYATDRRLAIYDMLENMGRNCWPPARNEVLKRSKFGLAIHQDVHPFQEPLRLALFSAYGLPIISETLYDSYPFSDQTMAWSSYDGLARKIRQALKNDYRYWYEMGQRARDLMTKKFQFGKVVRSAVGESVTWR